MVWKTGTNSPLGLSAPNGVADPTQINPNGTTAKFYDDVWGEGEFIYLPGVASCAAGDLVAYDLLPTGVTVTRATGLANSGRPLAVALGATAAGQWGWYQIGGVAIVNAVAGATAGTAVLSATTAQVQTTHIAGSQILGARLSSAVGTPAANKAYMTLNRPHMQGAIT
jgi:hypothetical protein